MRNRRSHWLISGLTAVLVLLLLAGTFYSQRFADFAGADGATEFYICTTNAGVGHEFRESRPSREEITPLLELLGEGTLRLDGRSRYIQWDAKDTLYHFSVYHEGDGGWVEDADFDLCTDGMVYVHHDWLGYLRYRLTGCDMEQVDAALTRLLNIARKIPE